VGLQYGTDLGSDLPVYAQFTLGGPAGFAGLAEDQFRGSTLGVASLEYRYRLRELPSQLGRGIYAVSHLDTGNVWMDGIDSDIRYGGSLGLGMDLNIGPLSLIYGYADGGYHSVYFSLGSDF
jgi:outer membrane protein insertion porin family